MVEVAEWWVVRKASVHSSVTPWAIHPSRVRRTSPAEAGSLPLPCISYGGRGERLFVYPLIDEDTANASLYRSLGSVHESIHAIPSICRDHFLPLPASLYGHWLW